MRRVVPLLLVILFGPSCPTQSVAEEIIHDAEYYILEAQHGQRWAKEDADLDANAEVWASEWFGSADDGSAVFSGLRRSDRPRAGGAAASGVRCSSRVL